MAYGLKASTYNPLMTLSDQKKGFKILSQWIKNAAYVWVRKSIRGLFSIVLHNAPGFSGHDVMQITI